MGDSPTLVPLQILTRVGDSPTLVPLQILTRVGDSPTLVPLQILTRVGDSPTLVPLQILTRVGDSPTLVPLQILTRVGDSPTLVPLQILTRVGDSPTLVPLQILHNAQLTILYCPMRVVSFRTNVYPCVYKLPCDVRQLYIRYPVSDIRQYSSIYTAHIRDVRLLLLLFRGMATRNKKTTTLKMHHIEEVSAQNQSGIGNNQMERCLIPLPDAVYVWIKSICY